jgi:hypothetical protein
VGKFNTGTEREKKREETVDPRGYARYVTEVVRHNDKQYN